MSTQHQSEAPLKMIRSAKVRLGPIV